MSNIISSAVFLPLLNSETKCNGAAFTVKSKKTGKEYTYKISVSISKDANKKQFIWVAVETQYQKWYDLGIYYSGKINKKKLEITSPSAQAISWILKEVQAGHIDKVDSLVEVYHTGHCLKCGRPLTDSKSIELGLGPICASY
jgi:hypothetical protein